MKFRFMTVILFTAVIALLIVFGPRPVIDETSHFDEGAIGGDVDAYLAANEGKVGSIRPGTEKEIVWAGAAGRRTPLSIIYLHGFSATKMETRPLPDDLAKALGANLYFARLSGHGGDGDALAEARMNDWVNDLAEAMAIGRRIGEKVIVIGTSTGATLAVWGAAQQSLAVDMHSLLLLSPNFGVRGISTGLLNMPWGQQLLPLAMGKTRSFEPHNAEHGKWWTTSYPSRAVFSMGALLKAVAAFRFENIEVPAMFVFSPADRVIEVHEVEDVYKRWGGPKQLLRVTDADDPSQHVIAGDILSPSSTGAIVAAALSWLRSIE